MRCVFIESPPLWRKYLFKYIYICSKIEAVTRCADLRSQVSIRFLEHTALPISAILSRLSFILHNFHYFVISCLQIYFSCLQRKFMCNRTLWSYSVESTSLRCTQLKTHWKLIARKRIMTLSCNGVRQTVRLKGSLARYLAKLSRRERSQDWKDIYHDLGIFVLS